MPPQQHHLEEPLLPTPDDCDRDISIDNSQQQRLVGYENRYSELSNGTFSEDDESLSPPPRNVTLVLLYTWVAFTGRGLWNQNCLATLVFLLRDGDPKAIGFLTAAMGMAQLCTSIPTGVLADKYRRDTLLKVGALVGIIATGVSIRAALHPAYSILLVALLLWGIHWGIVNTSIMALFSDSIPDGERSYYFTKRAVLINAANTCGPAIALIMFAVMGDNWTVQDCAKVLLAGNCVSLPGLFLLCWMSDQHDADESRETITIVRPCEPNNNTISGRENAQNLEEALVTRETTAGAATITRRNSTADTHLDETYDEERLGRALSCCCGCLLGNKRIVPSLIATTDIIAGFASGMSIRYIAIFLYDNLHLSPVQVQIVYIINPILQVVLRKQAQILAGTYGRCKVTVALKWIGISLMISMVVSYKLGVPRVVVCIILILRTCFMNSPSSLTKSILMDHVPKEERAKWASLESVSMVSWSGSAALGGILVESKGILFNFCFTAFLQFLATGPLLLLSFFDERHSSDLQDEIDDEDENETRTILDLNCHRHDENLEGEDNDEVLPN